MSAVAPSQLRRRLTIAATAALAALAVAPQGAAARGCANSTADPGEVSMRAMQKATLCILNRRRARRGIAPLRENGRLTLASLRHAQDMARRNYFEHGNFVGRIRSANYLRGARGWKLGENIAWGSGRLGTPAEIVDAWMHSSGHRANILNRGFREIGIGIARGTPSRGYGDGGTYVTDFGTRG